MSEHEDDTRPRESGLTDGERRRAEAHRGFVREMDRSLGHAYGRGGGMVVVVLATSVGVGWFQGWMGQVTMWLGTVTLTLGALYVVRKRIYARRDRLRRRVDKYCEVNDVSPTLLRTHYDSEDMYPFFLAMYEEGPSVGEEPPADDDKEAGAGESSTRRDGQ